MRKNLRPIRANRQAGFTLVELMVSLVLGMIITAAALAMFLSNKQVYATNEHLGRAQENVRTAYELMSREMREAAGGACEARLRTVNLLNSPNTRWWTRYGAPERVVGFDGATAFGDAAFGTAAGSRVAGTEAIELKAAVSDGVSVQSYATGAITLNTVNHGFSTGDIVMICDFDHASIVQLTNATTGTSAVVNNAQGAGTPGNCSTGLGFADPADCSAGGQAYTFPALSMVARMHMSRWFIGVGSAGGNSRSLYQSTVVNLNGTPTVQVQEIAPGVQSMELRYLLGGGANYVTAAAVGTQWNNVVAVRVVLNVQVEPNGDGGDVVTRRLEHTVALRNRMT